MKKTLTVLGLFGLIFVQAQVGINTDSPKATLDVAAKPADNTSLDGIMAPRLTGDQLKTKTYTADQRGAMVYVTVPASTANQDGQTKNVKEAGQYIFDGTAWQSYKGATGAQGIQGPRGYTGARGATGAQGPKGDRGLTGATGPQGPRGYTGATGATGAQGPKGDKGDRGATGPAGTPRTASNGLTLATNNIQLGGTLAKNTTINQNGKNLSFTGGTTYVRHLGRTAHNTGHLVGSYNSVGANGAQSNPIYTIGSNYNPGTTTLGNMYGIGYTHGGQSSFITGTAAGWGLYVAGAGHAGTFLSGQKYNSYINKDGGNVGIGTASPSHKLDVNGNMEVLTQGVGYIHGKTGKTGINGTGQTASSYHPFLRQKTSSGHYVNIGGLGDWFGFVGYKKDRTANGYDHVLAMNLASGNVGIGTAGPGAKLDVNGNVRIRKLDPGAESNQIVTVDGSGVLRKVSRTTMKGDKGDTGATGATGARGPRGYTGATGATGAQGPKGDKGDRGATGPAGTPRTASNGLTLATNNIQLGGTLAKNTTINQNGKNFSFTGAGNVGIGTTAPQAYLHLKADKENLLLLEGASGHVAMRFKNSVHAEHIPFMHRFMNYGTIHQVMEYSFDEPGKPHAGGASVRFFKRLPSFFGNPQYDPQLYQLRLTGGGAGMLLSSASNGDGEVTIVNVIDSNKSVSLDVAGFVKAKSFRVGTQTLTVPDYVFQKYYTGASDLNSVYEFKTLSQVEDFVKTKGHLPGYLSAKEVKEQGSLDMTKTQLINIEKIEELYLHTIEQEKRIEAQNKKIEKLEALVEQLIKNK